MVKRPVAHRRLRCRPGSAAPTSPASSAVGDGERLEDRAELVAPLRGAVEERAVGRVAAGRQRRAQVRVEVGQARERPDLAGVGLHQDADRALGAHLGHALRPARPRARSAPRGRSRAGAARRPAPGRAAARRRPARRRRCRSPRPRRTPSRPKLGAAEHVRRHRAVRVEPRLARAEEQAGLAEVVHQLALLGRDRALDPEELPPVGELGVELVGVEVGEDPGQRVGGRRAGRSSPPAGHRARR